MNSFLKWCSFSWLGHVVLFEAAVAAPLFLLVCVAVAIRGSLNVRTATTMAIVLLVVAAAAALVTWFSITRPLIRRG